MVGYRKGVQALGWLAGAAAILGIVGCRKVPSSTPAAAALPAPLPYRGFLDITAASGVAFHHSIGDGKMSNLIEAVGGGTAFLDYDQDGDLDLYVVSGTWQEGISEGEKPPGRSHNHLYRNRGNGTFEDVTEQARVAGRGYGMGVAVGDYNNDGYPDLYVVNYGPNILYRNNGDGTFSDVTSQTGVGDPGPGVGAAFLDYDNDGWLDLYVGNYVDYNPTYKYYYAPDSFPGPLDYPGHPDVLYRNRGDGTFEDVTRQVGVFRPDGRAMGVTACDVNEDGFVDLYVCNDAMPNYLFLNEGGRTFREVALEAGVAYTQAGDAAASMVGVFGDYDGDGDGDFFISDDRYGSLYRNEGVMNGLPLFTDVGCETGIAEAKGQFVSWAAGFIDYDNDGDLDLFIVNGALHQYFGEEDLLLENDGRGRFQDVSTQRGEYFHHRYVGRGACFGDIDNDGDVDVFIVNLGQEGRLLRNDGPAENRWLLLRLVGTRSNRDAVGTRVKVICGLRTYVAQRIGGGSYLSSNDPRLHFGLGRSEKVDRIEVFWPSGRRQVLRNVPTCQILTIIEPKE